MAESVVTSGDQEDSEEEAVKLKPSHRKPTPCDPGVPEITLTALFRELKTVTKPIVFGIGLGVEEHILETIEADNRNYVDGQRTALFLYLADNHRSLKITWDRITSVLEEFLQMRDLAKEIRKKFVYEDSSPHLTPPERVLVNPRLSSYRNYLQSRYRAQISTLSTHWPPISTSKVFKLAIVKKEKIQMGKIDDDFVRLTITGKIDDILAIKVPVDLENILSETTTKRKLVLIEGAPGSGKSTLALHICQEWGEGKLFQEYDVVVLVRLRDPLVRNAKSVADLLPCVNKTMADEAETAMISLYGRGVLWVLDGWDELPPDLPQDSIVNKLVQPGMSQESPLHECAVIVTSRPSSSASLHPLVSSRVEVLGFTPDELEQYFTECLKGDSHAVKTLLDRIRENPVVEGSCYLPLNASIVAQAFLSGDHSLPTSNHGIFVSVVQCTLNRYLQDKLGKTAQVMNITCPDSLPQEIQAPFTHLCKLSFYGIENNKVTFTPNDLLALNIPIDICDVGLLQSVPSIISNSRQVYFCFLHLSIQELLAAINISKMSPEQQISVFQKLFGNPRFSRVFQFYAGMTKLRTSRPWLSLIPRFLCPLPASILDLVRKAVGQSKSLLVSLLHCLYEAEDTSLCVFVADLLNHKLYLSYTTLSPLDCLSVGYFLSVVSTTTSGRFTAYLRLCSIGDQGCKFLVKGLCKCLHSHSNITSHLDLNLGLNNIHEEGAHSIAELLKTTSVVCKLRLRNNHIGDSGLAMVSLCEALSTNNTLEELDLDSCSLTVSDEINGLALCELLSTNTSLKFLNLSSNYITGDSGLKLLCEALSTNTTLEELNLTGCSLIISNENGPALCELLSINSSLKSLHLSGNLVTDHCYHIAAGLKKNSSLTELRLISVGLTNESLNVLATGLNNHIKELYVLGNDTITKNGMTKFLRSLRTLSRIHLVAIPDHLVSPVSTVLSEVNEERRKNGLPKILVKGWW